MADTLPQTCVLCCVSIGLRKAIVRCRTCHRPHCEACLQTVVCVTCTPTVQPPQHQIPPSTEQKRCMTCLHRFGVTRWRYVCHSCSAETCDSCLRTVLVNREQCKLCRKCHRQNVEAIKPPFVHEAVTGVAAPSSPSPPTTTYSSPEALPGESDEAFAWRLRQMELDEERGGRVRASSLPQQVVPTQLARAGSLPQQVVPVQHGWAGHSPPQVVPTQVARAGSLPQQVVPVQHGWAGHSPPQVVPTQLARAGSLPQQVVPVHHGWAGHSPHEMSPRRVISADAGESDEAFAARLQQYYSQSNPQS